MSITKKYSDEMKKIELSWHTVSFVSSRIEEIEEEWSNDWVPRQSTPDIYFRRLSLSLSLSLQILDKYQCYGKITYLMDIQASRYSNELLIAY